MSRTYRTHMGFKYYVFGKVVVGRDFDWENMPIELIISLAAKPCLISNDRDYKPGYKPTKEFKKMKRRNERAKVNNALRNDKEIPLFKKTDEWEWN